MNIEQINIILMPYEQTFLCDEGFFHCDGYAIDQRTIIITDGYKHRARPCIEIMTTINHELLHIILEEIEDFDTSVGLDNISLWNVDEVTL